MIKAKLLVVYVAETADGRFEAKIFADGEKIFNCVYDDLAYAFYHTGAKTVELVDLSSAPELTLHFVPPINPWRHPPERH